MDAATLRHLFEPFFTTKPAGEGTGLGTAMIYGLVQEHRGHIHVESESGHGATVQILFPLAQTAEETAVPPGAGVPLDGTEAILLADDEELLRVAAKRVLERHGYTVWLASDGADALGVYLAREREIALIVSDVVMPRMSGPEPKAELRRRGKAPRILFTSGYTARDAMHAKHLGSGTRFIPKPWTAAGLLRAVRAALDGEPGP